MPLFPLQPRGPAVGIVLEDYEEHQPHYEEEQRHNGGSHWDTDQLSLFRRVKEKRGLGLCKLTIECGDTNFSVSPVGI